jgi:hypothetical protein
MKFDFDEVIASRQIKHMLHLQDEVNTKVNFSWRSQDYSWCRAIWTECAELLDHYGWKWWKHQEPDLAQVRLELVDIWHFGLSWLLQHGENPNTVIKDLVAGLDEPTDPELTFQDLVEAVARSALTYEQFVPVEFAQLMVAAELTLDELYRLYVGKSVLNHFRQDFGYREGTYCKVWDGREDNEHLYDLIQTLDANHEGFMGKIYLGLVTQYPRIQ